jgi:uncharacterized repeat protein (TIGR04138 family)
MTGASLERQIELLTRKHRRYRSQAYYIVLDSLDFISRDLGKSQMRGSERHVSVEELLDAVKKYAREEFGPLARMVFEYNGIFSTQDIGEIVFIMVEAELLNSRDCDCKQDFADAFDFREAFEEGYEPEIPWRSD